MVPSVNTLASNLLLAANDWNVIHAVQSAVPNYALVCRTILEGIVAQGTSK